jgi:sigma-B regulation protein RsbU (phosphoserine phosphatase)
MYVTACAGYLDLTSGQLVAANAGHPPPYRLGRDGGLAAVAIPASLPLGMLVGNPEEASADDYPTTEISLAAGECLYLYSDGVTEAFNSRDELFGPERLEAYLRGAAGAAAAELVQGSMAAVQEFVGDHVASDDITAMSIRYLGR